MPGQQHVSVGCINGTPIYRVDNPFSGCSAGFWTTRLPWSVERDDKEDEYEDDEDEDDDFGCGITRRICAKQEIHVELDFFHAGAGRCRCLGQDTDSPAVRDLLEVALGFSAEPPTSACTGVEPPTVANTTAAMLVLLGRVLQLPSLGDADLDLWARVHMPTPPPPTPDTPDTPYTPKKGQTKNRISKTSFLKKPSKCMQTLKKRLHQYIQR